MKDFTTYDLPLWLNAAVEELERRCMSELKEENLFYNEVLEETKALSRFLALEGDRRDMENIQSYLLGCRHALEILLLLKMI